jgi:hypothetical protein
LAAYDHCSVSSRDLRDRKWCWPASQTRLRRVETTVWSFPTDGVLERLGPLVCVDTRRYRELVLNSFFLSFLFKNVPCTHFVATAIFPADLTCGKLGSTTCRLSARVQGAFIVLSWISHRQHDLSDSPEDEECVATALKHVCRRFHVPELPSIFVKLVSLLSRNKLETEG